MAKDKGGKGKGKGKKDDDVSYAKKLTIDLIKKWIALPMGIFVVTMGGAALNLSD
jgi:hypothetical protein